MLKSINQTAKELGIGRTNLYQQIKLGRLSIVKIGRRTLVKSSSIEALINQGEVIQ